MREKKSTEHGTHGKRKRWSAAEKLRIVLLGMEPGVEVSDVCRREGLNPTMYYQWKRTLLGAAERILEKKEAKPTVREERLSQALSRAKEVIVEITTENLELKKRSRTSGSRSGAGGGPAAGGRGGAADAVAERLVGATDAGGVGDFAGHVLPLAEGRVLGLGVACGGGSGPTFRGLAGRACGHADVCPGASDDSASGVSVVNDRR